MLAYATISPYNDIRDFRSPIDYLKFMFGDREGWQTRNIIFPDGAMNESFVRRDSMMKRKWNGRTNCFISMNSFLTPKQKETPDSGRVVNNLKHLNALWVDIDYYTKGLEREEVLYILRESYFDRTIPYPTFIIDSGKGLYLIWKIDEDRNALPRWQAVENYLIDQLKDIGADSKAKDAARILRVPFTVNGKNGKMVRILNFANIQYKLHEIIREYQIEPLKSKPTLTKRRIRKDGLPSYPYGQATEKQRRTARWIATDLQIALPDFTNYGETANYIAKYLPTITANREPEGKQKPINLIKRTTIKSILAGRMADLRRLFAIRKGEDCCREYALFLYRLWCLDIYNDAAVALEETLAFNAMLDRPFNLEYVVKATASAEKKYKAGETYYYSTKGIVSALGITAAEQEEMKYLCGCPADEKERKKRANRRGYLSRLEKAGKETKKTAIQTRRENIAAMLAEGKDKAAICHALNLSARTFDRDKAAIVAEGLIEKVKATMEQAAQEVKKAVEEVIQTTFSAFSVSVRDGSPIFQPSYYTHRTSVACTANTITGEIIGTARAP